ncbi:MAG: hypothetical protein WAL12_12675, partial [Trebonia sp.]
MRDLLAQGLSEAFEGEFGGAVGAEPRCGELAANAGELDHPAASLPAHVRQRRLGQRGRAEVVEVEQVPHLGLGGLLQGADLSPSGTVYQDIEA